jgi:hypothetical protein
MNFKKITILGLAVGMQLATFAQAPITQKRNAILAKTPEERLQILQENFIIEQKELNETLAKSGQPRTMVSANGNFMEAKFLSNGLPVYVQTLNNTDAAKTISTNKVQPGGSLGLSLTGSGMTNAELFNQIILLQPAIMLHTLQELWLQVVLLQMQEV